MHSLPFIYIYLSISIYLSIYPYLSIYIYIYRYLSISIYLYISLCIYIYIYLCQEQPKWSISNPRGRWNYPRGREMPRGRNLFNVFMTLCYTVIGLFLMRGSVRDQGLYEEDDSLKRLLTPELYLFISIYLDRNTQIHPFWGSQNKINDTIKFSRHQIIIP